jgi:hypothetical protein
MSNEDEFVWLRRRLDAIIQLLLENGDGAAKSVTDKIGRLLDMGFTPAETAKVVGKPTKYVWTIAGRRQTKGASAKKAKAKKQPVSVEPVADASVGDVT